VPWRAQPGPQLEAIRKCWVEELLFGGAVYGGKSDFLLGDFAQDVPTAYGAHSHGILFRKNYPQLEELIARSKEIYPAWFALDAAKAWSESKKTWTWPNGATLKMRFMESDDDWQEYWGHAFTWMGWDELGLWASPVPYLRMKARLRSAQAVPNKRIRASANPGGAGHHWVKSYFAIDRYPLGGELLDPGDGSGMRRLFVRSRLQDNRIGLANDPGYSARLEGLGSSELVRSLKDGNWNVVSGAFFNEFSLDRHVVAPVELPDWWPRIRGMDWGSARPFAVLWAAVSDGSLDQFARGALVFYRELYGWNGKPNEGSKQPAEVVGAQIRELEQEEKIFDQVIDPAAFASDGGPSIAERLNLNFRRADNTRIARAGAIGGWDQVRQRLRGDGDGRPLLHFFSTCEHSIRTLPALQHDKLRLEDVDSSAEDHAPDAIRYVCMSRPIVRDEPKPKDQIHRFFRMPTFNELVKESRARRLDQE
jgi:hypothetical protein